MRYNLVHVTGAVLGTVIWQNGRWVIEMLGEGRLIEACYAAVANALAQDELGNCSKAYFKKVMDNLEAYIAKYGPDVPVRAYPIA